MKVLILSHSSDLAGAEQSMLGLFDYWREVTDIKPEFIIRKPLLKLAPELKKRGFKYHTLHYTNWAQRKPPKDPADIYWYAKQNTKAVKEIEEIIKAVRPRLVMTNTIVAPWAAIAARKQKIPHVWFIREFGNADADFEFTLGQSQTFEIIGQLSDLVVANSQTLADFAAKHIDKTKIAVLYPAVDFKVIEKLAKAKIMSPFKDPASLKLITIGRIAPSKGQATAAAAAGILNSQGINCELCIVGKPSDKGDANTLKSTIKKYQIASKVHLIGYQANPLAYAALADIGIMPSDKEAFGRTTLEYMALGKPVVGANSGATPELLLANHSGFLYEPNDPSDLAKKLLNYAKDRRLIIKHGQAAKQQALRLSKAHPPDRLYRKLLHMVNNRSKDMDHLGDGSKDEWNSYPLVLSPNQPKPRLLWRRPHSLAKRLLKSLYLKLK